MGPQSKLLGGNITIGLFNTWILAINELLDNPYKGTTIGMTDTGYCQQGLLMDTLPEDHVLTLEDWDRLLDAIWRVGRHQGTFTLSPKNTNDPNFSPSTINNMIDLIPKDIEALHANKFKVDIDVLVASHNDQLRREIYTHHLGENPWPGSTTLTADEHIEWEFRVQFKSHCHIGSFFNSGGVLTFMPEFTNDRFNAQSVFWNSFLHEILMIKMDSHKTYSCNGVGEQGDGFNWLMDNPSFEPLQDADYTRVYYRGGTGYYTENSFEVLARYNEAGMFIDLKFIIADDYQAYTGEIIDYTNPLTHGTSDAQGYQLPGHVDPNPAVVYYANELNPDDAGPWYPVSDQNPNGYSFVGGNVDAPTYGDYFQPEYGYVNALAEHEVFDYASGELKITLGHIKDKVVFVIDPPEIRNLY